MSNIIQETYNGEVDTRVEKIIRSRVATNIGGLWDLNALLKFES